MDGATADARVERSVLRLLAALLILSAGGPSAAWAGPAMSATVTAHRATEGELPSGSLTGAKTSDWRHTSKGWERMSQWRREQAKRIDRPLLSAIHPGLVAVMFLLLSLGALLAFPPGSTSQGRLVLEASRR